VNVVKAVIGKDPVKNRTRMYLIGPDPGWYPAAFFLFWDRVPWGGDPNSPLRAAASAATVKAFECLN
jgi:hypothetical protein